MHSHIGKSSLCCCFKPHKKNYQAKPIHELLCNWYSNEWFRGLSAGHRTLISPIPDIELPPLVSWSLAQVTLANLVYLVYLGFLLYDEWVEWSLRGLVSGPLSGPLSGASCHSQNQFILMYTLQIFSLS